MRWRQDAALQRQRSVWREHDATLAKAWLAKVDHEMIELPDFDPRDFDDVDSLDSESMHRVITLD
jgi:hypothetical protein